MTNGNRHKTSALPNSIKGVQNRLLNHTPLEVVVNGIAVNLFHYSNLAHQHARQLEEIPTFLAAGENMGKTGKRTYDYTSRLNAAVGRLKTGDYITLACEDEDIIVVRAEDITLLSNLYGEPAELFKSSNKIDEEINIASFLHNTALVLDATELYMGRQILVTLSDSEKVSFERLDDHLTIDIEKDNFPEYRFENENDQPRVPNESSFKTFLSSLDTDKYGVVFVPNRGHFIVQKQKAERFDLKEDFLKADAVEMPFSSEKLQPKQYGHEFWQDINGALQEINDKDLYGIVRKDDGELEAIVLPSNAISFLKENEINTEIIKPGVLKLEKDEWLGLIGEKDAVHIYQSTSDSASEGFLFSRDVSDDLLEQLGIDPSLKALKENGFSELAPQNSIKKIKHVSVDDFSRNFKKYFSQAEKSALVKAIRGEHGETLAIIMPLDKEEELRGSLGAKKVRLDVMQKDFLGCLEDIRKETQSIEVGVKGRGVIAVMLSGDYEDLVAGTLPENQIVYEERPAEPTPSEEGMEETQNLGPRVNHEYTYQIIPYSQAKYGVAKLREAVNKGQISILADQQKGLAVFIPEELLSQITSEQEEEWAELSSYAFNKKLDAGAFATLGYSEIYKIQPRETPFKGKADFSPKNPYGVIPWSRLSELASQEILPEIPAHITKQVNFVLGKIETIDATNRIKAVIETERTWRDFQGSVLTKTAEDINTAGVINSVVSSRENARIFVALPASYASYFEGIRGVKTSVVNSGEFRSNMAQYRDELQPNEVLFYATRGDVQLVLLHASPADAIVDTLVKAKSELALHKTAKTDIESGVVADEPPESKPESVEAKAENMTDRLGMNNNSSTNIVQIEVGKVIDAEASFGIAAKLAAIKAANALSRSLQNIRSLLKNNTGFIPVKIADDNLYATRNPEFLENAQGICEAFEVEYEEIDLSKNSAEERPQKWVETFGNAASNDNKIIVIKDTEANMDVAVFAGNSSVVRDVMPQLGIKLEF